MDLGEDLRGFPPDVADPVELGPPVAMFSQGDQKGGAEVTVAPLESVPK